jgi:hypothetical protein
MEPVCTVNENTNTVTCTRTEIQGVGNTNAVVELVVEATATGTCTNRGGNLVEPFTESFTDETPPQVIRPNRNGNLIVNLLSTTVDSEDFLADFDCPNRNWNADVSDISINGFTYTLTFAGCDEAAITITGP